MNKIYRFTMVELLVVIGIIFILTGIMLPVLSNARRKAREINCIDIQKQIGFLLMQYEEDFNGLPYAISDAEWGTSRDIWVKSARYLDPQKNSWPGVYYNIFLIGCGYTKRQDLFLCPLYGSKQDTQEDHVTISPNAALFASNSTQRYPGAIYIGDGYGTLRLRCSDWSFRWRHGSDVQAKPHPRNLDEIGYDTVTGSANFLFADGSVKELKASFREQICRDYIAYMGKGKPRGNLYWNEGAYDHTNCKSDWTY